MRRTRRFTAGPLLVLSVLAACRDGVVSPEPSSFQAPASSAPAPISLAPQSRPTLDLSGQPADSASVDFVVGPNGGIFYTAGNAVVFPSQSVCDPATSSYGISTWDQPCTPLQSQIKVHAEIRRKNGRTWVDFTPSLRFVPTSNPTKWVWVVMYTPDAIGATSDLSSFNILWTSAIGAKGVDETPSDATLRTYVDTWRGVSMRRIKHFSGYVSGSGRTCDPAAEECPANPPPE